MIDIYISRYYSYLLRFYQFEFFSVDTDAKSGESLLSKADKETKRKANSFKRDPLTQTKLGSFFKKASDASPASTPDESDNDALVIDDNKDDHQDKTREENSNCNDTTLKIKEINDDDDNKNAPDQDKDKSSNINTFVINITLKGIPPKEKEDDINKTEHETIKKSKEHRKDKHRSESDKKAHEKEKAEKPAKRKIKALFGESSESESESPKSKKPKTSKSHKSEDRKSKSKKKHDKDKESSKHKKQVTSPINPVALFGNMSDSESEKELVIDDGGDEFTVNKSAEETLIITDIKSDKIDNDNNKSTDLNSETSLDMSMDSKSSSFDRQVPAEDANLNKARKLSLEADEIMQKLKNFTAPITKPEAIDMDVEITPPDFIPDSPSPTKLRDKVQSHIQDIFRHRKLSLSKKNKEESNGNKKPKEENSLDNKKVKEESSSSKKPKEESASKKPNEDSSSSKPPVEDRKARESKKEHVSSKDSKHRSKDGVKREEVVKKKSEKVDLAGMVVKLLMPYYKKKKISSRDLFKTTARHIVHQLLAIQVTGKFVT